MMESTERLIASAENKDWDALLTILKPKDFCSDIPRLLSDFVKLVKVAELLTDESLDLPEKLKNVFLKCLANSCVNGYIEKEYPLNDNEDSVAHKNIYKYLSQEVSKWNKESLYPYHINFPYDGVVRWSIKTVSEYAADGKRLNEEQTEVLRLSIQFLCNYFTFAFDISISSNANVILDCVKDQNFKNTIIKLVGHDRAPIARAACAYVHNMVKQLFQEFYPTIDKKKLTTELIKSTISDIQAALDTITLLLRDPNYLKDIYEEVSIDDRLYLLDIIHQEVRSVAYNEGNHGAYVMPIETIEFLADNFKKKSDLILKTVDTHVKNLEPTEVTILLDILGVLTSNSHLEECKRLQEDKSLLINCIYLLKAVHMAGKETNNCFTPLQKLSDLAIAANKNGNETEDSNNDFHKKIQSHPAFGFKAGVIRVIGNLVHKHEKNQNLVRELDGLPLLLDCCNLDARNPLIIQWTTLATRNVLENNSENQEVVSKMVKIGTVDSVVLRELGLTLHNEGDGKAIGIMPLPSKN
ncbi:ataxin-10 [Copidosoma floridanum]|uniref:ataxin-10 n=1 Tax=Copidosoma floridanum TaxID=29053 RepID=UPI0006C995FF|nr:ataxin-10 [Copidosoma floridanum]XP_014218474.1 ataxin-10 [Copidosoma floridanum]XP_014218475.1 ataxin-10 [Copidosoma floridanum]